LPWFQHLLLLWLAQVVLAQQQTTVMAMLLAVQVVLV
jgi:hypothetical protein